MGSLGCALRGKLYEGWVQSRLAFQPITVRVNKLLGAPARYPRMTAFLLIIVALLLVIPEIFFWVRSCFRKYRKQGSEDNKSEK